MEIVLRGHGSHPYVMTAVVAILSAGFLYAGASGCQYRQTDLLASCGSTLDAAECGIVTAKGSTVNGSASDCRLSLRLAPAGGGMVLAIESALVRNPHILSRRCDSYFRVLHDANSTGEAVALSRAICSHELDQQVFYVPWGTAGLVLHTTGPEYVYLSIVYTILALGPCNSTQLQCGGTASAADSGGGGCLASSLVCDGHNNCGDASDENRHGRCRGVLSSYHVTPLGSAACVAAVLVVAAFSAFYCTRPREPRWYRLARAKEST